MPLKVGSVILYQYWPMLVVCAASSAEVRSGVCTTSDPYSPSWCLGAALSIIDYTADAGTVNDARSELRQLLFRSVPVQRSRDKDNLAGGSRLQHFLVCSSCLRQRQLLADNRAERTVFQAGDQPRVDFRDFRGLSCPQRECEDSRATCHQVAGCEREPRRRAQDAGSARPRRG